jgi:hypothetical protein
MNPALTANETTILAAIISAVTSIIVTLIALRFGPNYKQQIMDLNQEIKGLAGTLSDLLERQSSISQLIQKRMEADAATVWQPTARIENAKGENFLVLKADREFKLVRIAVKGPSGAEMFELPKSPDWDQAQSKGFRVSIPQTGLTNIWNNSGGPRMNLVTASISCEVSQGDVRGQFSLPIMLKQEFITEGTALTAWIKATG